MNLSPYQHLVDITRGNGDGVPVVRRNTRPNPNRQMPHRPPRVIPSPLHYFTFTITRLIFSNHLRRKQYLRTQIPTQINHHRATQLRRIRPPFLNPRIRPPKSPQRSRIYDLAQRPRAQWRRRRAGRGGDCAGWLGVGWGGGEGRALRLRLWLRLRL